LWLGVSASAQVADVQLGLESGDIGLEGFVQPGLWTPMRLSLINQSAEVRNITARWIVADEDGDLVLAQRTAALNPGIMQQLWLYADVPMTQREGLPWQVQILDEQTNRLLTDRQVAAAHQINVTRSVVGVCATVDLGLSDYEPGYTQHESPRFVRGLALSRLPDRWYGLSMLRALIWTNEGADPFNDPSDASVTPEIVDALRDWVRRGGHLVISLPAVGQSWSDSPLGDLMPVTKQQMQAVDDFDAIVLGPTPPDRPRAITATVFDANSGATVLAVDRQKRPYIVAKRYGFGRVTLIGVDLSSGPVRRLGLPSGRMRVWHTVFHWNAPLVTQVEYEGEKRNTKMATMESRSIARLDGEVLRMVAMTGKAAAALLSAIVVFALYWLLAGPVMVVYLKRRGKVHYSWLAFVALGCVFTAITWGGAWALRPAHTALTHVSVLDIDANTSTVRTRSWLSLLVPRFGQANVVIDPEQSHAGQWLGSPGFTDRQEAGNYLDSQSYVQNVANPRQVSVPVRSTAKRFSLDYMGRLDTTMPGIDHPWVLPQGKVQLQGVWPVGELMHNLPGELKNVYVIFCPGTTNPAGDLRMPWIAHAGSWHPKQPLTLQPPPAMAYESLLNHATFYSTQNMEFYSEKRSWTNEGYLGRLIRNQKGGGNPGALLPPKLIRTVDDRVIRELQMLSFYDALPPPSFRDMRYLSNFTSGPMLYQRALLRCIDFTPLIAGKRLIIIGQLEDSPLPAPLTVDGQNIPSIGLVFVRWIYDL